MADKVTIALDAMGGDNAPGEIVAGAVSAVNAHPDIQVILCGKEEEIRKALSGKQYPEGSIQIENASEVIETAEHPVEAIRRKKDSSLMHALQLVKSGEAQAVLSAGNSGAVMVGGQLVVGRIRGIDRSPFAGLIPTKKGVTFLLDCGANVDARPNHLVQWAKMGSIYMEHVLGVKNPTVGLVNIGAEEEKGNALVRETFPLLKAEAEKGSINFIGSAEARDIPAGVCDVAVCDGFTGNVVIKMYEGTAKVLLSELKGAMMSSAKTKIGALLIKNAMKEKLGKFDASRYGGAPILGLKGLVVKMHGNAKAVEVERALDQCVQFYREGITEKIEAYAEEERKKAAAEKAAQKAQEQAAGAQPAESKPAE